MPKTDHPVKHPVSEAPADYPKPAHFPPDKHPHMVEVPTKGAPPLERNGELVEALYSRQDANTGKVFDYYPRYRLVDSREDNGQGGWIPVKKMQVTLMRRARKGQRDPFASQGVRPVGEVKQ